MTILPLTYQASRPGRAIPEDACERAKALYEKHVLQTAEPAIEKDDMGMSIDANKIASERKFIISMYCLNTLSQIKIKKLISIQAADYDFQIDNLLRDKQLPDLLQSCFEKIKTMQRSLTHSPFDEGIKIRPMSFTSIEKDSKTPEKSNHPKNIEKRKTESTTTAYSNIKVSYGSKPRANLQFMPLKTEWFLLNISLS